MPKTIDYILTAEDEGLYLKEILQRRFSFSGRLIKKIKYSGDLILNGSHANVKQRGRKGDILKVICPEEESWFEPQDIPFKIAYEDEDLLIADKQPFLVVHPTHNYPDGTLANAAANYLKQSGQQFKIRFANRLDRDTSGLIIIAKNSHAQDILSEQMQAGEVRKTYLAILHGILEGEGTVNAPINRDPGHIARRKVSEDGYPSITHYKSLETIKTEELRTPEGSDLLNEPLLLGGYTMAELALETGRTHQIRVHMTHIGHPLVGDELYGQLYGFWESPPLMPRQALHARSLEFFQPSSGEKICVTSDIPADMAECWRILESGERIE